MVGAKGCPLVDLGAAVVLSALFFWGHSAVLLLICAQCVAGGK